MNVGVLGGGQLARMLALAGIPLGHRFTVLEGAPDPPAAAVSDVVAAAYDDPGALAALAAACDAVTYEFENVPAASAEYLAGRIRASPPPQALEVAQDRLAEKEMFRALGVPTPAWHAIDAPADLEAALEACGLPTVIKARRLGYDGRGQTVARTEEEARAAVEAAAARRAGAGGLGLLAESFVRFERELSLLAVASRGGELVCYPVTENHHRGGILRASYAPAPGASRASAVQVESERIARLVADRLGYCGVLAVELFQVDGRLLANEIAPRVHNSGHWTIDGADCCQFENHVRAVTGMPIAAPRVPGPAAMINIIGSLPDVHAVAALPGARLHLYDKKPRAGRKLGHVNVVPDDPDRIRDTVARLWKLTGGPGPVPEATNLSHMPHDA